MSDQTRDRAAVEHHRSGAGIVKARDTVEDCLVRAVRPDQAENGAVRYLDEVFAASNRRLVMTDRETRAQEEFREVAP